MPGEGVGGVGGVGVSTAPGYLREQSYGLVLLDVML